MSRKNTATGSDVRAGGNTAWRPADLREEVAALLGTELSPADDEVNLFELGLQSIQLMRLINRLNRAGIGVDFTEMAQDPRLAAWYGLLGTPRERAVPAAGNPRPARTPPTHARRSR